MVTPVILTANEEANIGRTLEALRWAPRVVVLDSGSTDRTEEIARSYPNVQWHTRPFDSHAQQWLFGVHSTGIGDEFVLALDADMVVPPDFVAELRTNFLNGRYDAGVVSFRYAIQGRELKGSIYPNQIRLFRPSAVSVRQRGHTQVFEASGSLYRFKAKILHDDRKSLERWLQAQVHYSRLEYGELRRAKKSDLKSFLRRIGLMPFVAACFGYLRAGGPFCGMAATTYAMERLIFEALLTHRVSQAAVDSETIATSHKNRS